MDELLASPKAFITSLAALAVGGAAIRILQALISAKVVEWAVLRALTWLAGQSKSNADDELVALVRESLQGSSGDIASPSGEATEPSEAVVCPACGQPMPK